MIRIYSRSAFRTAISATYVLAVLAGITSQAQSATEPYQPRSQRVDLGGYRLFTSVDGAGRPMVVFVAGLGENLSTWQKVQPKVAEFTGTFAYDRAGIGKSNSSPATKSVESMVSELHVLLGAAKIVPPYILVGHSLGGAIAQLYAFTYPRRSPAWSWWTQKMADSSAACRRRCPRSNGMRGRRCLTR